MRITKKKLILAVLAIAAAVGGGRAVLAVWTVTGNGSGAGGATVAQSLTVTEVNPSGPGATLYPGGPAGPADFTVTNPNPFAVTITGITWGTPISNNPTACANGNIALDANAPSTGLNIAVSANTTSGAFSVPGVLDLSHSAPNGCEGVTFTIPMTVQAMQQ